MKKLFLTLVLVLIVAFNYAHPPKSVTLSYNSTNKTLQINIVHKVSDATSHYVDKITISVNGVEKKVVKLEKQTNENEEVYTYNVDLKSSDKVKVTASCNKMGSKSAKLSIK